MKRKLKGKFGLLFATLLAVLFLASGRKRRARIAALARRVMQLGGRGEARDAVSSGAGSTDAAIAQPKPTLLHSLQRVAAGVQGRIGDAASEAEVSTPQPSPDGAACTAEPGATATSHPEDVAST